MLVAFGSKGEGEGIPMEYPRGCGFKSPHISGHGTEKSRVGSPTLGRLYPRESPGAHFTGSYVDLRTMGGSPGELSEELVT